MKKLTLISTIVFGGLFYNTANAQIGIHLGLHINTPVIRLVANAPVYDEPAPADYDAANDYYYLPDVNAYYSVAEQCYYYNDGDNWISAAYLPGEYRNYDWRNARHFEVRARRPYLNNDFYRSRFNGNVTDWRRFDNRDRGYANRDFNRDQHFSDRPRVDDHRFDNRGGNQNNFARPENRNDNNYNRQQQPDRGQNQPSRQNNNDRQRDGNNAGGQQHFSDNHSQGSHDRFSRT
jgi:hypothetical protein